MITPKMDESLASIFNTELTETANEVKSLQEIKADAVASDIVSLERQREYVKDNLVKLIERGMNAVADLNIIANSTEKSRDFEVLGGLIKTLVDTNVELLNMEVAHKQKPQNEIQSNSQVTNNTAVFVGSTKELATYIRSLNTIEPD